LSRLVQITQGSAAPEHERRKADAVWWYASDTRTVGYAGAIPWNEDALFLCSIYSEDKREDVLLGLTKAFIEHAIEAGYGGCYAMTYDKDQATPPVLTELGFQREGIGRQWSDNPTTYWFRKVKRGA